MFAALAVALVLVWPIGPRGLGVAIAFAGAVAVVVLPDWSATSVVSGPASRN